MTDNELKVGEPRLGWLIDGTGNVPATAVMLRDTGTAIELVLPLHGLHNPDDPHGRWWSHNVEFVNDPERTRFSYRPPRVLLVQDNAGSVALVGCHATRVSSNFIAGQGRIVANFAVLGARTHDYEEIHALRTTVPALAEWTRHSSMKIAHSTDSAGRVQTLEIALDNTPDIELSEVFDLKLRPTWHTEQHPGRYIIHDEVQLETQQSTPASWDEHLRLHTAMLDLVSLAAWQPFGFKSISAMRTDDPELVGNDRHRVERWCRTETYQVPRHVDWVRAPQFLFPWSEVGSAGTKKWLEIQNFFSLAIGPVLNILRSGKIWTHANTVQSAIALEALGYRIDVTSNNGRNLNSRKQIKFKTALRVILDSLEVCPFEPVDEWIERAHSVYMGSKHPDRLRPDALTMINTLRENLLVLRYWVAQQVGATTDSLQRRLPLDPLAREFVPID